MKSAQPKPGEPITLVFTATGEPRYRVVLDAGTRATGKRRQVRSTHRTLTEARDHVATHKSDRSRGVLVAPDRTTFEDYARAWLKRRSRDVREVTAAKYGAALMRPIAAFGAKRLGQISRADVEAVIERIHDDGRSKALASVTLMCLRSVFEDAIDERIVPSNPAQRVKPTGKERRPKETLTAAQIATLRRHLATDPFYALWSLTLLGLRRSELLALRWSDIDLTVGTVTIARGRVLVGGSRTVEGATKTHRGVRVLPLPGDVLTALRKLRERHAADFGFEAARDGYIAVDATGVPIRHEWWSDEWKRHCKAAKVPVVSLHGARHSAVTTMREAGVPDHIVAAALGHSEAIMRSTYSHAHDDGIAKAIEALSAAYEGSA